VSESDEYTTTSHGWKVKPVTMKLNKPPRNDMTVTVQVELTRWYQLRYWTAVQLIRAAGWLLNSSIEAIREEVENANP
jgi:hypothetical protein